MLKIDIQLEQQIHLLILRGEIDASNSVDLDGAIQSILLQDCSVILVDGSALDYISSAGLGVFMSYLDEFQEKGIQIYIFGLAPKVFQVFEILGLDKLIRIRPTKEDVLALVE
ncbi:STAS domain-containing protein [Mongoliitalea daihaiensis]|uniref:STAS domain-containing protein n=1 Tax=Mongoliitalea daihaiensis TaxID=2782006 RepID=UPI001F1EC52A|nr:STAS domain-containing protein [Mongoliitalea daihaiensis]UJP66269.1 STAS domain-containing protein [Mongoliitalea daihaiensis]